MLSHTPCQNNSWFDLGPTDTGKVSLVFEKCLENNTWHLCGLSCTELAVRELFDVVIITIKNPIVIWSCELAKAKSHVGTAS